MGRKITKRGLLIIVCIMLCLGIVGIASAADEEKPYVQVESYDSFEALQESYKDEPGGYSGAVIRYVDNDPTDPNIANGYIRIDFGNYHIGTTSTIFHSIKYNPDVLGLAIWSGDNATGQAKKLEIDMDYGVTSANKPRIFVPYLFAPITYEAAPRPDRWENQYYFANTGFDSSNAIFSVPDAQKITIQTSRDAYNDHDAFTGYFDFTLSMKLATELLDRHRTELSIVDDNSNFTTTAINEPLYIGSIYFKVLGAVPTGDDIGLYKETVNAPNGSSYTGANDTYDNTNVVLLGFPAKAAEQKSVDITVKQTSDAAASVLLDATVTIKKSGSAEPGTQYTSGTGGKLIGVTDLKLDTGVYEWTVTPAASSSGLVPASGTFTVGDEPNDIVIYAATLSANVALSVLDAQSKNANQPLTGAEVLLRGTMQATYLAPTYNFNNIIPGSAVPLRISRGGYLEYAGNVAIADNGTVTYSADGQTYTNTFTLDQKKAVVSIEARNEDGVLTNTSVIIAAAEGTNASVTPYMADRLPIRATVDSISGLASFNLPNGDYSYSLEIPGYVATDPISFSVRNGEGSNKGSLYIKPDSYGTQTMDGTRIVSTVTSSTTPLEIDTTPVVVDMDSTVSNLPQDLEEYKLSDTLYVVEGHIDSVDNSKMIVDVYVKGLSAAIGSFGLKYDTNIFESLTFNTQSANVIRVDSDYNFKGTILENPQHDQQTGYHTFIWRPQDSSKMMLEAGNTPLKIATYTLQLKPEAAAEPRKHFHENALAMVPYSLTGNAATINNPALVAEELWRFDVDADMGYYRGAHLEPVDPQDPTQGWRTNFVDIHMSIAFDNSDVEAVHFQVVDSLGDPIPLATVNFYENADDTTTLKELKTDIEGKVSYPITAGVEHFFKVTADGYLPYPNDPQNDKEAFMLNDAHDNPIVVTLYSQVRHPVEIVDTQKDKIALAGETFAYNGADYFFDLMPQTGYNWAGNVKPLPGDLIVMREVGSGQPAVQITAISWDAARNCYKIDGKSIEGEPLDPLANDHLAGKITVESPTVQPVENTEGYKVTVIHNIGGSVSYTADSQHTYVVDPASPVDGQDIRKIVETLALQSENSTTYSFVPITPATAPENQIHIITSAMVNGVEVNLSQAQKENGFDYQFKNVTRDSVIIVSYGLYDKNTGTTEPIENADNANVTLSMGPYNDGSQVTYKAASLATIPLNYTPVSDSYVLDVSDSDPANILFKVNIKAAQNVDIPDPLGDTPTPLKKQNYIIDKVVVNGHIVYNNSQTSQPMPGVTWTDGGVQTDRNGVAEGTLSLDKTALVRDADGQLVRDTNIIVTFKVDEKDAPSISAVVETEVSAGRGSIAPAGSLIYAIGERPQYLLSGAASNWMLTEASVTPPSGYLPSTIFKEGAADNQVDDDGKYVFEPLRAGVTKITAAFRETGEQLQITVAYYKEGSAVIQPLTGGRLIFTRTEGLEIGTVLEFPLGVVDQNGMTTDKIDLPAGTWTMQVKKNGYLNRSFTGIVVENNQVKSSSNTEPYVNAGVYIFGIAKDSPVQSWPIYLTPGEANRDGKQITFSDAALTIGGIALQNLSDQDVLAKALQEQADINDNGRASIEDLAYVKANFGRSETTEAYTLRNIPTP